MSIVTNMTWATGATPIAQVNYGNMKRSFKNWKEASWIELEWLYMYRWSASNRIQMITEQIKCKKNRYPLPKPDRQVMESSTNLLEEKDRPLDFIPVGAIRYRLYSCWQKCLYFSPLQTRLYSGPSLDLILIGQTSYRLYSLALWSWDLGCCCC